MLQFTGSQRVIHDLVIESQQFLGYFSLLSAFSHFPNEFQSALWNSGKDLVTKVFFYKQETEDMRGFCTREDADHFNHLFSLILPNPEGNRGGTGKRMEFG